MQQALDQVDYFFNKDEAVRTYSFLLKRTEAPEKLGIP